MSESRGAASAAPSTGGSPEADAINAAAAAAFNEVFEFSGRFERREDYEPLEDLAGRVQSLVVQTFVDVFKERS